MFGRRPGQFNGRPIEVQLEKCIMKKVRHWQDPVNAIMGAWLILAPWALGFAKENLAMSNATVVGVLLLAVALGATFVPRAWEEWTEGLLGLWLIASPWVIGFTHVRDAMANAVVSGIVVALLALWALMSDEEYSDWMRSPGTH
jgi:heme/copper-type cytochrome/quinol oxidase subunit 3